ncbi:MAG: class I adenylate-forming enzyme family protein [Desulfotomaculales bacterium]
MHAGDLLSNRARLTPGREALLDLSSGKCYTYLDLNRRANQAANFLSEKLGVKKGDRVCIYAKNCVAYIDLLYAVGKIGAVLTPLNWRLTVPELAYIIRDAEPAAVIVGPEFLSEFEYLQKQAPIPCAISLEGAKLRGAISYEQELEKASDKEPARPFDLNGEDLYCILYTSGTTGRPKGAMIPHRQIIWNIINTTASWGLHESDISPVFTPLFHSGGLFAYLTPIFYLGGKIILHRNFDAEETLRVIEKERCTVILGVPTIYQMWLESPVFQEVCFSHVKYFNCGGAPLPKPLIEEWRKAKNIVFRQGYGLTEVGPNCFSMTSEESFQKTGSIGKPIFHSQVRLVDQDGKDVPPGEVGELIIKGPHVCLGYWRNPEATAESLKDGWFYSGDMARMDEDGFFYIVGRQKEMIISGGENIYAAEVEMVFNDHPAVKESALIGKPDPKWGEIGVLIVQLRPGQEVGAEELKQWCGRYLSKYKIPREIIFVEDLPHSPYGKVLKNELKKKYGGI